VNWRACAAPTLTASIVCTRSWRVVSFSSSITEGSTYLVAVIEPNGACADVGQERDRAVVEPRDGAGLAGRARRAFDGVVYLCGREKT
jgi:hypothetical protein